MTFRLFFCGDLMNSRIKLSARAAMNGSNINVLPALAVMMILFFSFSVCNAAVNYFFESAGASVLAVVAALSLPVFVAAVAPLRLILQIKFLFLARGARAGVKPDIGFSGALKACELSVRLFFIKLFWLSVFEAVPIAAGALFVYGNYRNAVSLRAAYAVLIGLSLLVVAGLVFYSVFVQRYAKSMFFLACYKDFTAGNAINESVRRTRGKLMDIFLFKLSFMPWMLLCIGVLPAFYVIPYYKQSLTCLYLSR